MVYKVGPWCPGSPVRRRLRPQSQGFERADAGISVSHCKHCEGDQQQKASGLSHSMGWTAQGEQERGEIRMEKEREQAHATVA